MLKFLHKLKFYTISKIVNNIRQVSRKQMIIIFIVLAVIGFSIQVVMRSTISIEAAKYQQSNIVDSFIIERNTSIIRSNKQWIVNGNVIQYSTLVLVNSKNNTIQVESIALLNYKNTSVSVNLTCLVKHNNVVLQINPSQFIRIYTWDEQNRLFYKIICNYKWNYNAEEEISAAIINVNEFQIDNKYSKVLKHKNSKYLKEYIQFQRVDIIDASKPKIPKVAHCVHFARINETSLIKRLNNWIEIQKSIGVDQITLFNYRVSDIVIKPIKKKYKSFVKIVQYKMDLNSVCATQVKLLKNEPDSKIFKKMFEHCKSICDKQFNEGEGIIIEVHEAINTNVCLTHYRYRYQFVTNYDFDEFIIPSGSLAMYNNLTCLPEDLSNLNYSSNFNINDMAFNLFNKKNNMSDLACLRFEHVLFIYDDDNLYDFIKRLPLKVRDWILVYLKSPLGMKVWFNITQCDHILVLDIKQSYELFKCLKSKYMNNSRLHSLFNNAVAGVISTREGKSIFNTDNTISVYQHSADKVIPNSYCVKVPAEDGYAGHFRNKIDGFFINQTYPLSHFQINLDYYKFLIKKFGQNI